MGRLIEAYDALGRYKVESESNSDVAYVVDLLAYNGKGQCSCDDWSFRIGPALEREEEPTHFYCKHIIAAREEFASLVIAKLIEQIKQTASRPVQI